MRIHSGERNGFSLLELMVVLTLTGLLIAIAIPTITTYMRTARLSGASNTLEADLHFAHAHANAERKTFQILFSAGSYVVKRVSPAATILTREMPKGVACAASDTATFYAWGLSDPVMIRMADASHADTLRVAANGSISHD
jgi:prepilin-type N-terminal cleavage/methylation domain-containing protein